MSAEAIDLKQHRRRRVARRLIALLKLLIVDAESRGDDELVIELLYCVQLVAERGVK
jgi:hypothetical protein